MIAVNARFASMTLESRYKPLPTVSRVQSKRRAPSVNCFLTIH